MEGFGDDLEKAIDEVRDIAHGVYPALLTSSGLSAALTSAARRAAPGVTVHGHGPRRCRQEVETAVYFSCLAALDNAAKHAGARQVSIRLTDTGMRCASRFATRAPALTRAERAPAAESHTCATASPRSVAPSPSTPHRHKERACLATYPTPGWTRSPADNQARRRYG